MKQKEKEAYLTKVIYLGIHVNNPAGGGPPSQQNSVLVAHHVNDDSSLLFAVT